MWAAPALDRVCSRCRVTAEGEKQPKQVSQSLLTVLILFPANLLIAIAKSVAAAINSSASMLGKAAHS
jgi:hypothetical protein